MITATEKYQGKLTAAKIFIINCFDLPCESPILVAERCQMTDLRCRKIQLALLLISHQIPCLGNRSREEGICRKGTKKFTSPGSRYLVMLGKLLRRATTSVNGRIVSTLNTKEKRVLHGQKSRTHTRIRSVDLHFV